MKPQRHEERQRCLLPLQEKANKRTAYHPRQRRGALGDFNFSPIFIQPPRSAEVSLHLRPEEVDAAQRIPN